MVRSDFNRQKLFWHANTIDRGDKRDAKGSNLWKGWNR